MFSSMLYSDFASAAVLISFGVVIGKTSPLQLIVMALIEIVLFTINEVIGRKYLGVKCITFLHSTTVDIFNPCHYQSYSCFSRLLMQVTQFSFIFLVHTSVSQPPGLCISQA